MTKKPGPIKVVQNAVDAIHALASRGALSPSDLSDIVEIPRSSVYRLVDALTAVGLAEPLPDGRVRLSLRWLQLADQARAALVEWSHAGPVLDELSERTDQAVFLSVNVGDQAVCIDWRRGRGVEVHALQPGRALPLYAGAAGRTLLAFTTDPERYLAAAPFPAYTGHTLTDADRLRDDVEQTRARGYAVADQDVSVGIHSVGAPIRDATGKVVGCVSISGLAEAFADADGRYEEELLAAAKRLTPAS